jgi:two-component system, OmpR family, alkaline phosphatase synthesis response regulator PhoP
MQILIVDDEASIRELLSFNLQKNGYTVQEAGDGRTALELTQDGDFDLLLLDIMLPELDGIEVCRRLKENPQTAGIPVIMLTARAEEIDKVLGLEMGADDYVTKPFGMRELLSRIKAVLRRAGSGPRKDGAFSMGTLHMDFNAYTASLQDISLSLTPKEYELLKLLVTNEGKAFSRDELLEKIWGYEYYGDTRTVDVHIRHLRAKLDSAKPKSGEQIETVRGVGYRFTHQ